jgi:hypothetical protein
MIVSFFIELLHTIWNFIKHIIVGILNFGDHIVNFFKNPNRLRTLKNDSDLMATTIKENLGNGNYNLVNCLFDKSTEQVVEMETNAQGIEASGLDEQTRNAFGDKDMIVLK